MKKWLFTMLVICLLMLGMTCAVAEDIYNNGEAPELIKVTNTQGEESAAVIRDAQGNIVATIPEIELMGLDSIGNQHNEYPEIQQMLYQSIDTLLKDGHIADAEWYVETDLFYVQIPETHTEHLTEGALAEIVFKPQIMNKIPKVLVLTSADGKTWDEASSVSFVGDGTVTLGIEKSCVVAFVVVVNEHEGLFGKLTEEVVPPTNEAVADETNPNFTPSVSGKPDPQIIAIEVEGNPSVALITTETSEILEAVTNRNLVIVTPFSERETNPDVITYQNLQRAYDAICAVPDLGNLPDVGAEDTLGDEIDRRLEGTGLDRTDMTVSDLFAVSVYGEPLRTLLTQPGARLELTVGRNFRNDEILMVLCANGMNNWHVVDEQYVTINADGSVTLSLEHRGVLVFLVEKMDTGIDAAADGVVTAP